MDRFAGIPYGLGHAVPHVERAASPNGSPIAESKKQVVSLPFRGDARSRFLFNQAINYMQRIKENLFLRCLDYERDSRAATSRAQLLREDQQE